MSPCVSKSLLIVGPTPPPLGGQAIMVQHLVKSHDTHFEDYVVDVVPVRYSRELADTGRFSVYKVAHLLALIRRVRRIARQKQPSILYYTPAGPTWLALVRDLVFLGAVRGRFPRTVFHFHAGGVSLLYEELPAVLRPLFRRAYWRPDLGILVAANVPDDALALLAARSVVVPNGVDDLGASQRNVDDTRPFRVLFVGLVCEAKGIGDLISAAGALLRDGVACEVTIVGERQDREFQTSLEAAIRAQGLTDSVHFAGVLQGDGKSQAFAHADVLCFPTFFESETFGLVAAEAMSAALPVIATRWRGLVDVVEHEVTGLLVEPRDVAGLAASIKRLEQDRDLAVEMGKRGRQRYEELFTVDRHLTAMRKAIDLLTEPTTADNQGST